jgi:enoyl-[acyl-carrier-protein] reductase (NADH)
MHQRTILIGTVTDEVRVLAQRLDADLVELDATSDDALGQWRIAQAAAGRVERVVVAAWPERITSTVFDPTAAEEISTAVENQLVSWIVGLGAAASRCVDGGAIVAVLDRPAPLDAGGHTTAAAVADAVEALVRSLARSEGPRKVRVNAVTTPARATRRPVPDPAPPLQQFPGDPVDDTIPVIEMLLAESSAAVTSQVVHADSGRSWR